MSDIDYIKKCIEDLYDGWDTHGFKIDELESIVEDIQKNQLGNRIEELEKKMRELELRLK